MLLIIRIGFAISVLLIQACGGGANSESTHPSQAAPKNPPDIKFELNDLNQRIINWQEQSDAHTYILYLSLSSAFEAEATTKTALDKPPYFIARENAGQEYFVKMTSVWLDKESAESEPESFIVAPLAALNVTAKGDEAADAQTIIITWDTVEGADTYTLYRQTSAELDIGIAIKRENVISPYYDVTTISDQAYFYWVVATANGELGDYSEPVSFTMRNQMPIFTTDITFSVPENSVNITTVQARDPENSNIDYRILNGDDAHLFSLGKESGELKFNVPADFENPDDKNVDNVYSLEIEASDGRKSIQQMLEITVTDIDETSPPTMIPTANAGDNQNINVNLLVLLDGSASKANIDDPTLEYAWTVNNADISLVNADTVNPTFTIPVTMNIGTVLVFTLVVQDISKSFSIPDTVEVTVIDTAPVADAGMNQNAQVADVIELDASASFDINGDPITYLWTTTSDVILSDPTTKNPTYTVERGTKADDVHLFNLSVSDNKTPPNIDTSAVKITILNTGPIANAGDDKIVTLGETVILDSSQSDDVNEDPLQFSWDIIVAPEKSIALIINPNVENPSFTPDVLGNYTLELTVDDQIAGVNTKGSTQMNIRVNPLVTQMVAIPGGTFSMGDETSPDGIERGTGDADEVPVHSVTIAPFEIGKYEVTFEEYDQYLQSRGIDTANITNLTDEAYDYGRGRGAYPVVNVDWNDFQDYLIWLNSQLGIALDDSKRYRLPSEAEWEYAARANLTGTYSIDVCGPENAIYDWNVSFSYTNIDGSLKDCPSFDLSPTQAVEVNDVNYSANPFGLFHMHGNIYEWVEDCYHDSYDGAPQDGSAWVEETNIGDCDRRVLRGGSWVFRAAIIRSANRGSYATARYSSYGFRLARSH